MQTSKTSGSGGEVPPESFGPYLVFERLGIGGMATVHRAVERGIEGLERTVALKRLLPHLAEDESFVRSFVREAKLASLLQHVNVAQIYTLGRIGSDYFISMELVSGHDLRQVLRRARQVVGPPPVAITVALLTQLCDALDHAHSRTDEHGRPLGIVHRDVSPSNLLLTETGHLKVIDFGIARAQVSQLSTRTGRIKGKLAYMAPEAVVGQPIDHRADLFAVGVVAHELLTATPLFAGENDYQTITNVQQLDAPPASAGNERVPPALDAIVARALAKDPADRWDSARALGEALHELAVAEGYNARNRDVVSWMDWAMGLRIGTGSGRGAPVSGSVPPALGSAPLIAEVGVADYADFEIRETPNERRPATASVVAALPLPAPPHEGFEASPASFAEPASGPHTRPDSLPAVHTGRMERTGGESLAPPPAAASATAPAERVEPSYVAGKQKPPLVGASILSREIPGARPSVRRLALAVAGGAVLVAAVALWLLRPQPPAGAVLQFDVEPADAQILIDGEVRTGLGPLTVEAGSHRVEIRRPGYNSYVRTLNVSSGSTQSMRVVLDQRKDSRARLHMIVREGIDLRIDGTLASPSAPIALDAGSHRLELFAGDERLWSHDLDAAAGTRYEFSPDLDRQLRELDKRRGRRERRSAAARARFQPRDRDRKPAAGAVETKAAADASGAPSINAPAADVAKGVDKPGRRAADPEVVEAAPPPPPKQVPRAPADAAPPRAPTRSTPAPRATRPATARTATISSKAVRRRSGTLPALRTRSGLDDVRHVRAKLCIDVDGRVTTAEILSDFPKDAAKTFVKAMKTWRYTPYRERGEARPACFGVGFAIDFRAR